jgi:hypothetical protein
MIPVKVKGSYSIKLAAQASGGAHTRAVVNDITHITPLSEL